MFKSIKAIYYRTKYIERADTIYSISEMPDEKTDELIDYIDDEVLIIVRTPTKIESTICVTALSLLLGFLIWFICILDYSITSDIVDLVGTIIIVLGTFVVIMYLIYYILFFYIYRGKRVMTFHRLTGMIELPKRWFKGWNGATIIFPFTDQSITWVPGFGGAQFKLLYPNSNASIYLLPSYMRKKFSFILWFMDRNRQLPPSKRLNPYRVKDFLRREAEGFPTPLRRADIKIPSHKTMPPELKKERKQEQH